eukprot:CAMPEP_0180133716 /NCGR_PEP_ID=MMETSP0986-20121125/9701_1 /TAXON_ID=697907 /ORGANISM="non described non described, Strain CCMP2293" /LENGTH=80 /DNA_ID=CAMNT_0022073877 /DNA_START=364 /DNA_END=606 /DNA_ORIENTATION=-
MTGVTLHTELEPFPKGAPPPAVAAPPPSRSAPMAPMPEPPRASGTGPPREREPMAPEAPLDSMAPMALWEAEREGTRGRT